MSKREPVNYHHWVYAIECLTPKHVYVGETGNFHRRLAEHRGYDPAQMGYKGSPFICQHGFKQVLECREVKWKDRETEERLLALALIAEGWSVKTNITNVKWNGKTVIMPDARLPNPV